MSFGENINTISDEIKQLVQRNDINEISEYIKANNNSIHDISHYAAYTGNMQLIKFIIDNYDVNEVQMARYAALNKNKVARNYILRLFKEKLDAMDSA